MSRTEAPLAPPLNTLPHVVAITGGKGGVGKTSIAVNLAIALARLQHRVCLLDGDTGLANVNILLGLQPHYTLEHLIAGERTVQEVMLQGPEGLTIIPGATGVGRCATMNHQDQSRLLDGLQQIESSFDWLLLDTAAGISPITINMINAAQQAAVVITPEPTSLTDAFSLLKMVHRQGYQRRVLVIVNMVSSSDQPQAIFRRFQAAVSKYIGIESQYLGSIWMDESLRAAVANQKPVATLPSSDPSCRLFLRLADSLISLFNQRRFDSHGLSQYWRNIIDSPRDTADDAAAPGTADGSMPINLRALLQFIQTSTAIPADQALTLASALLEHAPAGEFSATQIDAIKSDLRNRLTSANIESGPPPTAEMLPPATAPANPVKAPAQAARRRIHSSQPCRYDAQRFGSQAQLAENIKNLDDGTSLDDFLSAFSQGK